MNWKLKSFINVQLAVKESDLKLAESSLKVAKEKEEAALEKGELYQYGYWFGLSYSYENEIRKLNREIEHLKSELMEVEANVS